MERTGKFPLCSKTQARKSTGGGTERRWDLLLFSGGMYVGGTVLRLSVAWRRAWYQTYINSSDIRWERKETLETHSQWPIMCSPALTFAALPTTISYNNLLFHPSTSCLLNVC